jgi:2-haloacid dehalogenase
MIMESGRKLAVVFDAYGTLFDVHSVAALAETLFPGDGPELSRVWRAKHLEYSFLRTIGEQYVDFRVVAESALQYSAEKLALPLTAGARSRLMNAYFNLAPFPESLAVLQAIRKMGADLAILSNGTSEMLRKLISNAGMEGLFTHVLSADAVKKYKPDPRVYELACKAFKRPAGQIIFVSSNGWDTSGAAWYGFKTFWVNRQSVPPERLDVMPGGAGTTLEDLLDYLR